MMTFVIFEMHSCSRPRPIASGECTQHSPQIELFARQADVDRTKNKTYSYEMQMQMSKLRKQEHEQYPLKIKLILGRGFT